jgi:uncharacterized protein (TIGR02266 family)
VEVLLKVEYHDPSELLCDYITDLDEGGVFIRSNLPIEEGELIHFSLSFPGLMDPLELQGVVRWRQEAERDGPWGLAGLAVEFVWTDPQQRRRLLDLIDSLSREREGQAPDPAIQRPFRVLLVEDNDFVQQLYLHSIRKFHHQHIGNRVLEVYCHYNARTALEQLDSVEIDLAIVDHFLPGMTGCNLVRNIREDGRLQHMPILMVSVGGEEVRYQAHASGADLYLDKPVMNKHLIRTLGLLLNLNIDRSAA